MHLQQRGHKFNSFCTLTKSLLLSTNRLLRVVTWSTPPRWATKNAPEKETRRLWRWRKCSQRMRASRTRRTDPRRSFYFAFFISHFKLFFVWSWGNGVHAHFFLLSLLHCFPFLHRYLEYAGPVQSTYDQIVTNSLSLLRCMSLDERASKLRDQFKAKEVSICIHYQ